MQPIYDSEGNNNIYTAKNKIFTGGLGIGANNSISLHTNSNSIYRVTGMSQIEDIINSGYVRPKLGKLKGGHVNEVFWTIGGERNFYYDKRPVIETTVEKLRDEQIGALSIDDLSAVWLFNEEKQCYENRLDAILQFRRQVTELGMPMVLGEEYFGTLETLSDQKKL